ncbi:50S ribosomal protein L9 [Candidatus Parcubacteria bacterium]|nr:50S ribosomal protein L9 [Candidatus Parcubacteria bacterium]
MKVILLQDIEHLGRKHDVKDVADGYARNFLLPRKLVKIATPASIKEAEKLCEQREAEAEEALKRTEELASRVDGLELRLTEKANETGTFFAAISSTKIAAALTEQGFAVAKEHVNLAEPIKEPGEYDLTLNLEHGLEAQIKVIAEAGE